MSNKKYGWDFTDEEIRDIRLKAAEWHHSTDVYKYHPSKKYSGSSHGNPVRFFTNCDLNDYEPYVLAYEYNGAGKIFLSQFAYDTYGKHIRGYWALFLHHTILPKGSADDIWDVRRKMRKGFDEFEKKYNWKLSAQTWDKEQYYKDKECSTIMMINGPGIYVREI